jgi:hypothetical protein
MYDEPQSLSNVSVAWITNEFDFETMKKYLIDQYDLINVPRSKSRVYQIFGHHYFKKMTDKEWEVKRNDVFVDCSRVKGIK